MNSLIVIYYWNNFTLEFVLYELPSIKIFIRFLFSIIPVPRLWLSLKLIYIIPIVSTILHFSHDSLLKLLKTFLLVIYHLRISASASLLSIVSLINDHLLVYFYYLQIYTSRTLLNNLQQSTLNIWIIKNNRYCIIILASLKSSILVPTENLFFIKFKFVYNNRF